jgi:hypothetical protein
VGVGDPFVIAVEGRADAGVVAADSMRAVVETGRFAALGPVRIDRQTRDGVAILRVSQRLACLDVACAPGARSRNATVPAPRVLARSRGGVAVAAAGRALAIAVVPRVPRAAVDAASPPFVRQTALPPPSYRVSPHGLATGLDVGAAFLVLVAAGLGTLALTWGRNARRSPPVDPLTRALALARESVARSPADRRVALGLLAATLTARSVDGLADAATALAWSQRQPEPKRTSELVDEIARAVGSAP